MSGHPPTRAALAGGPGPAFAPLVWRRLPAFVRATAPERFWTDAALTQRLLADAAAVCGAGAVVVPVLPGPTGGTVEALPAPPEAVVGTDEVAATLAVVAGVAAVGATGVLADVPSLAALGAAAPGAAPEDVEDLLADLVRACLEAGADAITVRGRGPEGDGRTTAAGLVALADFYGAAVIGVDGPDSWVSPGHGPVTLLGPGGPWPVVPTGVVLTDGDLGDWATPDGLRALRAGAAGDRG